MNRRFIASACALSLASACAAAPRKTAAPAAIPTPPPCARVLSNDARYTVCYNTTPSPIPLNEPFDMQLWVYEGDGTAQLSTAVILDVDAGMPAHRHGMNVVPQVRALNGPPVQDLLPGHGVMSDGRFEVRGMLFHMPGSWELRFDLRHGAIMERAQASIDVD